MTTDEYLALITTEHQSRPRFMATVQASVAPFAALQTLMRSYIPSFDVDSAVGRQLDIVGLWVGVNRRIGVPIGGFYFTWDDTTATGWNSGVWKGVGDPDAGFVDLPDDLFRKLIQAKIEANNWDGGIEGAYRILDAAFNVGDNITIKDNQDMTMTVTIVDVVLPPVEQALLTEGYIPIKPAGVEIDYVLV
jgi:hypothetical protein